MIARKAQSGKPPSGEDDVDSEETGPWEAPTDGTAEPEPEAAGAAMARASDVEAASPTAKRRVVEALTASPAVVVPRKVTVAV